MFGQEPINGRPVLVSAGSSPAGMEFAATHSNIVFATSPTGASPEKACVALSEKITTIKERARTNSRTVKVLVNPHVICRPTDGQAVAWRDKIFMDRDRVAA